MRTITKLAPVLALAFGSGIPAASAAGSCTVQANWGGVRPNVSYTAAVNCTSGTVLVGCFASAAVVDEDTNVRTGIQTTGVGHLTGCGTSYSTTAAVDSELLGGSHRIEAIVSFTVLGDPVSLFHGGDTAYFLACTDDDYHPQYFCIAESTSY